jgi:hypothetical protein
LEETEGKNNWATQWNEHATCQATMYNFFFVKKSGFLDFSVSRIHRSFSPLPWKTVDRENTVDGQYA